MSFERARLVAVAVSAPLLFVAVVIAAAGTPGYSHWRDPVSRLASPGQPWALYVRVAFISYALIVAAGAGAVRVQRELPAPFPVLLGVSAVGGVLAALAPKDMPGAPHTVASSVHVVAAVAAGVAFVGAIALAAFVDESPVFRRVSLAVALFAAVTVIVFRFSWGSPYYGALQRTILLPPMIWMSVLAAAAVRRGGATRARDLSAGTDGVPSWRR